MDLKFDAEWVNPVLMVKDFNQKEFTVCEDFMTNADTPYLALNGVVDNPVNPFTNKPIVYNNKSLDQLVYVTFEFNTLVNNGTQFKDPQGYW